MLWGFDLLIFAGVLGLGGSYITIKSNIEPFSPHLAGSFWGQNPYQVRNLILMRNEAIAGTVWMGLSLAAMSAGTIITSMESAPLAIQAGLIHTFVIIGLGCILVWMTLLVTHKVSRNKYVPQFIDSHREVFARCVADIKDPTKVDECTGYLNQIGTLIDVPRLSNENNAAFLERLKPLFRN
jgi:hypothetical protein